MDYAVFLESGPYNAYSMFCPVIEYTVDGISYRVKKRFSGINITTVKNPPHNFKPQASESDSGRINVRIAFEKYERKLAEELWPINSKAATYYNPNKPKTSYVERPIASRNVSNFLIEFGIYINILTMLSFIICFIGPYFWG